MIKHLGEQIFSRDETGRLKARIGTLFLKTPGLVTLPGIHATQRIAWIHELNRERAQAQLPPLTSIETNEELSNSVDLLFDDQHVLIRPDPYEMDLAFQADEILHTLVSKRKILFLNTKNHLIRNALRARGENWRMSRMPVSPEEMNQRIANARIAIGCNPIYFYNPATGTRFLTLDTFTWLGTLPDASFRKHLIEIVTYSAQRNRFGYPEIDIFPLGCLFTRQAFEALNAQELPIDKLRSAYKKLLRVFRDNVPSALRSETFGNMVWRNLLCDTISTQPNAVASDSLVDGISPEYYMQIEWLPGCRMQEGELIFDSVFEELDVTPADPELRSLCDPTAKELIFNYIRQFCNIEYINIGRISRSLSIRSPTGHQRANVYLIQVKEVGNPELELRVIRFQKWGICEHLDDGKDLLQAIMESVDYTDYVLDRRLACRQLGMHLPAHVSTSRMPVIYTGSNTKYTGSRCWAVYFERHYVAGTVTDKIQPHHYQDPEFNRRLARLLGEAAAINCVIGRATLEGRAIFDDGDEVIVCDANNLPDHLIVTDHTGSIAQYNDPLGTNAKDYALPVNKRDQVIPNATEFAKIYLSSFRQRLEQMQQEYRLHQRAFDKLFKHRPVDNKGSLAFRWQRVLARLEQTDAAHLAALIHGYIKVLNP